MKNSNKKKKQPFYGKNNKQRFFGDRTMPIMLALLSAFPPLSIDLYLPALPHMTEVLNTTQGLVNLTLSLFFLSFAVGILILGPVSEKYGRKPVILCGMVTYLLASIACALSSTVVQLIIARVFQAFGGGAATAVSTAIVKDMYSGRKRESVLAVVMAIVIIAPVVAPVLGAVILKVASWRAMFWVLAGVSAVVFALSLLLDETLENRYSGSLIQSLGRLAVVMKNPGFSLLLCIFSFVSLPMMAFIAVSSFIYIQGFGMTEEMYSYYFAFNALGAMAGPLIYIQISKYIDSGNIITGSYVLLALSGILIEPASRLSPAFFALNMAAATLMMAILRPPTANLLLSQQQGDTGSAASLINFMGMLLGSAGMFVISLAARDLIFYLGLMQIVVGGVCGTLWVLIRKKSFIRQTA